MGLVPSPASGRHAVDVSSELLGQQEEVKGRAGTGLGENVSDSITKIGATQRGGGGWRPAPPGRSAGLGCSRVVVCGEDRLQSAAGAGSVAESGGRRTHRARPASRRHARARRQEWRCLRGALRESEESREPAAAFPRSSAPALAPAPPERGSAAAGAGPETCLRCAECSDGPAVSTRRDPHVRPLWPSASQGGGTTGSTVAADSAAAAAGAGGAAAASFQVPSVSSRHAECSDGPAVSTRRDPHVRPLWPSASQGGGTTGSTVAADSAAAAAGAGGAAAASFQVPSVSSPPPPTFSTVYGGNAAQIFPDLPAGREVVRAAAATATPHLVLRVPTRQRRLVRTSGPAGTYVRAQRHDEDIRRARSPGGQRRSGIASQGIRQRFCP